MADSDKNILITPNKSGANKPSIVLTGKGVIPITLNVNNDTDGTLTFEGSSGVLFSLDNNLSYGKIFSINDASAVPLFDVDADGTVRLNPYGTTIYVGGISGDAVVIRPATRPSTGAGANITIAAGSGVTTGGGGSVILQPGAQAAGGGNGRVIVRGLSGSTANLQEWQNSASTILGFVASNGVPAAYGGGLISTNTAFGVSALVTNTTGSQNTAIGYFALNLNTTAIANTAVGYLALSSAVSSASYNAAFGTNSLQNASSGNSNAAFGCNSLTAVTTGIGNTGLGQGAGQNYTTGSNNVAIGHEGGRFQADGSTILTTPANSIYIGVSSRGLNNSDSNSIVIGYQAIGKGSNTTVIGTTSTTTSYLYGETHYIGGVAGTAISLQPQPRSTTGAGANVTVAAGAGVTTGAGGSIILQPGAQATSGGNGVVVVRQPGGTAGTDELQIYHDGTHAYFTNKDTSGNVYFDVPAGTNPGLFIRRSDYVTQTLRLTAGDIDNLATVQSSTTDLQLRSGAGDVSIRPGTSGNYVTNWFGLRIRNLNGQNGAILRVPHTNPVGILQLYDNATASGGSIAYPAATPTILGANTPDLALNSSAFQRLSASAAYNLTGIAPPATASHTDGRLIWLYNVGSFNITLKHSQTSTAGNQFVNEGGGDIVLGPNRVAQAIYDTTTAKWRVNGETYPYVFPTTDGTNGQVLTTNASGTLSWTTIASSGGIVTSVSGTGTVNGITLTGTVTSTGSLTLGGTLSGVSLATQVTGTLPLLNGGTGTTTAQLAINALAGAVTSGSYLRGNGTNVVMTTIQAADVPTLNQNTTGTASGSVSGTASYVPKFTSTSVVGNSVIYETGSNVGIGTTVPAHSLVIASNSSLPLLNIYKSPDGVLRSAQQVATLGTSTSSSNSGTTGGNEYGILNLFMSGVARCQLFAYAGGGGANNYVLDGMSFGQTSAAAGQVVVAPVSAATKGLIVKGFTNQSANLQEWQNSTPTTLAYVDSAGGAYFPSISTVSISTDLEYLGLGKTSKTFVRTVPTAPGDYVEITTMGEFGGPSYEINVVTYHNSGENSVNKRYFFMVYFSATSGTITPIAQYGIGSSPVHDFELEAYRESAGLTVLRLRRTKNTNSTSMTAYISITEYDRAGQGLPSRTGTGTSVFGTLGGYNTGSAQLPRLTPAMVALDPVGLTGAGTPVALYAGSAFVTGAGGAFGIYGGNATGTGAGGSIILQPGAQATSGGDGTVISRRGTSGVSNIHQFQVSTSTYAFFDNSGRLCITPEVSTTVMPVDCGLFVTPRNNANTIGVVVRGVSGQAGNLQEWQNSASTILGFVASNGVPAAYGGGQISTNTAFGVNALLSNTTGLNNTAIGKEALRTCTTSGENTAVGAGALFSATTGAGSSVAIGSAALYATTTGSDNTAVGVFSLLNNTTGSGNTALGEYAGRWLNDRSSGLTAPTNSVYIGFESKGFSASETNAIVIGYYGLGRGSNTTVIGNISTTTSYLYGETHYIGGVAGTAISLQPQTRSTTGAGANVTIAAGAGVTTGAGGSIILQPGAQATSGGDGYVVVNAPSGASINKFRIKNAVTANTYVDFDVDAAVGANQLSISGAGSALYTIFLNTTRLTGYQELFSTGGNYISLSGSKLNMAGGTIFFGSGATYQNLQTVALLHGGTGVIRVADATSYSTLGSSGGSFAFTSSSPGGYTGDQTDLVLNGSAFQRLSGTAARSIFSIAPPSGGSHVDGRMIRIYNVGTFNLTLKHNYTTGTTQAYRMFCVQSADIVIATNDFAELIYDGTNNGSGAAGWRVA